MEEFLPEFASENLVGVKHDLLQEAMKFDNVIYESFFHGCHCVGVLKGHKMGCLREPINDHHDHGISTGIRKSINKVHG
jgi:hypothetical protein